MTTKTAQTQITNADVVEAQGGIGGTYDLVTVECPEDYDVDEITAADIVHDSNLRVVDAACDWCNAPRAFATRPGSSAPGGACAKHRRELERSVESSASRSGNAFCDGGSWVRAI